MTDATIQQCPVCNRAAAVCWWPNHLGYDVQCEYCGAYRIGHPTFIWMRGKWDQSDPNWLWPYLSIAIRQASSPPELTLDTWHGLAAGAERQTADDKSRALLALLKARSHRRGELVGFEENDQPLVGIARSDEADYFLDALVEQGLIKGNYPLYSVTPKGWEAGATPNQAPREVFLSHAAVDAALAAVLSAEVSARVPTAQVFAASQPGAIATGEQWLAVIEQKLQTGHLYVILLTPSSIARPWLWFETGSVWFLKNKRILPVLAGGLGVHDVPYPLAARQLLNLENPADVQQFFGELGATLTDGEAHALVARLRESQDAPSI